MSEPKNESQDALSPSALGESPLRLTLDLPVEECAPDAPILPVDEKPLSPLERPGWFQRPLDRR